MIASIGSTGGKISHDPELKVDIVTFFNSKNIIT
jgi:hypothetical protein